MTGIESVVKITMNLLKTNSAGESCSPVDTGCYLPANKVHKKRHTSKPRLLETLGGFFF